MNDRVSQTLPAPALNSRRADDKWQREYRAFLQLKPQLLPTHVGSYVTIHGGQVIDSGADDVELALRFFKAHGNVPVHIGLVTPEAEPITRIPHYRERSGTDG